MFCKTCEQFQKTTSESSFVTGCSRFRKENLSSHNVSQCHKLCAEIINSRNAEPGKSVAEKALQSLNKEALEKMRFSFEIAMQLQNIEDHLQISSGCVSWTRRKIAPFFFPYYVMIRQDYAVLEQVIVYIRYCVEGNVHVDFVAVKHVERKNATQIYECTVNVIEESCGLGVAEIKDHLVDFASDGAAVMRVQFTKVFWKPLVKMKVLTFVLLHVLKVHASFPIINKFNLKQVQFLQFFCDLLSVLSTLSLLFQKETLTIGEVHNILEDSITTIKLFEDAQGFQLTPN
ncbi:hypothetical protein PR048_021705 [Dryococelus australis]|uniref:Uncharacterized protein n=1 Tax=Dryococelus australis TaxID=614101 RepID=A0ABQ9GZ60_9NEOP|nr:hypothetical protein PR048_021705 [Dryococelus australis]